MDWWYVYLILKTAQETNFASNFRLHLTLRIGFGLRLINVVKPTFCTIFIDNAPLLPFEKSLD